MQTNRREFLRKTGSFAAMGCIAQQVLLEKAVAADVAAAGSRSVWPTFRGDAFATGQAARCLPADLELIWKYEVEDGAFESTPAIVEGICYLPDLDGTLHALRLSDGTLKWKKKTGAFAFAASPAIKGGRLFVGDIDGVFYSFDLEGNEQWKFTAQAEISGCASFYNDQVLFGSQDATLYCLDRNTGTLTWKIEVQDQIRCSPTVVEDRSFVAGCDGRLHIIDLTKGAELESVEIESPTGVTPAVMGDHVFFGTEAGDVFRVNWRQAKIDWRFTEKRHREIRSSAAVSKEMLVVGSRSKNVYGIDPKTGKEVWTFTCKRGVDSSPLIACDRVFVASTDGRMYLLDLMTGKELWKKEVGGGFTASPASVDGKLIIASDEGVVYCFGSAKQPG